MSGGGKLCSIQPRFDEVVETLRKEMTAREGHEAGASRRFHTVVVTWFLNDHVYRTGVVRQEYPPPVAEDIRFH